MVVNENLPFEHNLIELEGLVRVLEKGELSLEESIITYEMGVNLTKQLNQKINDSKKKLKELKEIKEGNDSNGQ